MLDAYRQLFDALHEGAVDYCVWKNSQELAVALEGTGDIDVYVTAPAQPAFRRLLAQHGFVGVRSAVHHPAIEHHYGLDAASGRLCHLHCHFRLITGESHIKQFVIPIEHYIGQFPAEINALGVREMHPTLQYALYRFRRCIKMSCMPGLMLYLRERRGYIEEASRLAERTNSSMDPPVKGADNWLPLIAPLASPVRNIAAGLGYRWRFRHWNRYRSWATPWHRYHAIARRFVGKLVGRKKRFAHGIVVTVVDGPANERRALFTHLNDTFGAAFDVRLRSTDSPGASRSAHPVGTPPLASACTHDALQGALVLCDDHRVHQTADLSLPSTASTLDSLSAVWKAVLRRNLPGRPHSAHQGQPAR